MTGAIRSSSPATARWTSAIWGGGGGASGTGQQSSGPRTGVRFRTGATSRVAGVLRPVSLLPALVVVATLLGAPTAPATAQAARARVAPADLLGVKIESLSSSEIPRTGPIVVTGSVTNRDE